LEADPLDEPAGASQPGDPAPHRCGRHLPDGRLDVEAYRDGASGAERRVGGGPAVLQPRVDVDAEEHVVARLGGGSEVANNRPRFPEGRPCGKRFAFPTVNPTTGDRSYTT